MRYSAAVMAEIDRELDAIAEMLKQKKDLLSEGVDWRKRDRAGRFQALELVAPIAINGVIRHGLSARISCRSDVSEADVHAQLQVHVPLLGTDAHICRVEWRPASSHTNPATAPAGHRFKSLKDRWYDFGVNRRLGIGALRQTVPMCAQELPRNADNFNELLELLGELWNVSGIDQLPIPPWEDRLV